MVLFMVMTYQEGNRFWFYASFLMFFFSFFPFFLERVFEVDLPWQLDILITIAIIFHYGGEIFDAYATIPHFDVLAHIVTSVYIGFFGFVVIVILNDNWDDFCMSAYAMAFVVALFTVVVGVIWEFQEWMSDYLFNSYLQYGDGDTVKDLFVDMMTGIVMGILGIWLVKKDKLKGITKVFGEQVYKNILTKIGLSAFLFLGIAVLLFQASNCVAY